MVSRQGMVLLSKAISRGPQLRPSLLKKESSLNEFYLPLADGSVALVVMDFNSFMAEEPAVSFINQNPVIFISEAVGVPRDGEHFS